MGRNGDKIRMGTCLWACPITLRRGRRVVKRESVFSVVTYPMMVYQRQTRKRHVSPKIQATQSMFDRPGEAVARLEVRANAMVWSTRIPSGYPHDLPRGKVGRTQWQQNGCSWVKPRARQYPSSLERAQPACIP